MLRIGTTGVLAGSLAVVTALGFCPAALADVPVAKASKCLKSGEITPICGVKAPEDLELAPDGQQMLISQSGLVDKAGATGINLLDLKSASGTLLVPVIAPQRGWGVAGCSPPAALEPHGIHLSKRSDRRWQLLVVNHGAREGIEFYELSRARTGYRLHWRGCVPAPAQAHLNDVVATSRGFITSVPMADPATEFPQAVKGLNTGYLLEWTPAGGMMRLANSEASYNNGVQLSRDERYVIFAAWTGKKILKYDRRARAIVASVDVDFFPDNLSVRADGRFVTAGVTEVDRLQHCGGTMLESCPIGFAVAAIDPDAMQVEPLYRGAPGLLPVASVALHLGNDLYVGAVSGERLLKIDTRPRSR
jgi:hypothetical protein